MTDDPRAVPVCDDGDLWALCSAMCDGTIDEPRLARLERLLETDPASRQFCALYLRMNGQLMRVFRPIVQRPQWDEPGLATTGANFSAGEPSSTCDVNQDARFHALLPVVTAPLTTRFLSGWPVAYLIATVIFAVGLLAGSVLHVSHSPKVVKRPVRSSVMPGPATATEYVGRITGMLDCHWADSATPAFNGAYVPLGRKYELTSGYMEITYNAGAKVVLQGPVTYEVESAAGGYLSGGKLTAKLEKKVASGQWPVVSDRKSSSPQSLAPSPSSNPQSLIPNPLFAIRTPTATVTDLGTEFGVEVCDGGTAVHTFRGLVEVQLVAKDDGPENRIRLGEKESVRIEKPQSQTAAKIVRDTVDPAAFVRAEQLPALAREQALKPLHRWQAYSEQLRKDPALVAYYTFEAARDGHARRLPNLSAAGSSLDGTIQGADWVLGRLPGKHALYFHGPGSGDAVVLPEQERFNFTGPFSVAVWFKAAGLHGDHQGLVAKGILAWRLQELDAAPCLVFCTNAASDDRSAIVRANGETDVADRQWHLAVGVYEPNASLVRQCLYIDGRLDAEQRASVRLRHTDDPVLLGTNGYPGQDFLGWIDEVAILSRALSAKEVAVMFSAGLPQARHKTGLNRPSTERE